MKRCVVWQSMSDDNGGMSSAVPGPYYWSEAAAAEGCSRWGGPPNPKRHDALMTDDGKVFLLSDAVTVFDSREQSERDAILQRLTPRERKVLGF